MNKDVKKVAQKKTFLKFTCLDIVIIKLSVFFFTLFLVYLLPQFFTEFRDWKWAFLTISVLLSIKPLRSFFKK
jgi:uncharacterized protein YqhQ